MPTKVFVSHSHKDDHFTSRLVADLKHAGAEVWVDVADLGAGDFQERINKALNWCEAVVLVLTKDALASKWVTQEINAANSLIHEGRIKHIIPVLAGPVDVRDIPPLWKVYNRFDAATDYAGALISLLKALALEPGEALDAFNLVASAQPQQAIAYGPGRRLPMYLLLDCSATMSGEPITALNEGTGQIYRLLSADPQAVETVYISIIRFGGRADQMDLVPIDQFVPPTLEAGGRRVLGAALNLLANSIEHDLVVTDPKRGIHGDYRPLVFLITDGPPEDEYLGARKRLDALRGNLRPTIVALGAGPDVDLNVLRQITPNVFMMHDVSPEAIKGFFRWIS